MIHIIRAKAFIKPCSQIKGLEKQVLVMHNISQPFMQSTAVTNDCYTKQSDSQVSWPSPYGQETEVCHGSDGLINFFISMMTVVGDIITISPSVCVVNIKYSYFLRTNICHMMMKQWLV